MESLKSRGSIPAQKIRMADNGATLNVGDVDVKPGFVVAGQVRLSDGKPVPPKTRVLLGREDAWDTWQATLDDTGHFRFEGVPPEEVSISARANGYHMSVHNASLDLLNPFSMVGRIAANKTDLIVELEPGKDLQSQRGDYQAYEALREQPLRGAEAAGAPNPGDIKVTGTVVDAETKKPIPAFTVTEGRPGDFENQISWLPGRKSAQSNGTFTVYLANPAYLRSKPQLAAVLIEAPGYFPQASGTFDAGGTNLTVSLKKGAPPSGVVLNPDGSPAADVKVYLTDMKNGVYVGDSDHLKIRDEIYRSTASMVTDAKGHFTLPLRVDSYSVIVLTDQGFADVRMAELEKNPEVRLQPLAHIDGKLMIGNRPGSNEVVRLGLASTAYEFYPRNFSPMNLFLTTKTDDEGKFSFKQVPPVAVEVYQEPKVRDSRQGIIPQSQTTKFLLRPGETRHLELGGKGRPVVGRFVVTNYDGEINYRADVQSLISVVPQPADMPDMAEFMKTFSAKMRALTNDDEKKAAMEDYKKRVAEYQEKLRDFYQTDAGRQYSFAQRNFALNFSQDGSFRVEDVPGGKYTLRIDLRENSGDGPMNFNAPEIASYTKEIEVPDSPNGVGEAQDLGTIQVSARKVLKTGTAAPDFNVKTLDGKPLKLSDFKGKYVLLDFWATWCGPCVAETPSLQAAWSAFKNDPRFVMVSLSLDPEMDAPRNYAAKNKFEWYQGFLGDWEKSDVPATFGVEGIPAIFLIGPDGKIVARDLRGDAIKAAIADALQKK